MNMGNWCWETLNQLPVGAANMPGICASEMTQLPNSSGNQDLSPLSVTMDTVQMYIGSAAQMYTYILIEMSPNPPDEAKISKTVLYNLIGTVVYQIRKLDISCLELK
jgi:hypothetical protein